MQNYCPPNSVHPAGGYIRWGLIPTDTDLLLATYEKVPTEGGSHLTFDITVIKSLKTGEISIGIEISYIPKDLITVIFYYQISLNPLKTQSLSQVSFPLLFPLRYIVPPVFTNSDKGKNKGKKII